VSGHYSCCEGELSATSDWLLGLGKRLRYTLLQLLGDPHNAQRRNRKKNEFIVEQQAQFAADIQQLQESQARTEQVLARTVETVAQTTESVVQIAQTVGQVGDVVTRLANVTHAGFTEVNAKITALFDAQIRTEANLDRLEENLERTDRNVDRTDENLRNLIAEVDRHLREGRNGN
jgi:hypothetical protein